MDATVTNPRETVGIDYADPITDPRTIVEAGYSFVMRYVSPIGSGRAAGPSSPNPKDVTADELHALVDAGLAVGLVFESTANRALGGASAGHQDGQTAAARAAQVGYPLDRVMYWAVDFPAAPSTFPTLQAYGEGFAAGWPGAQHGPYGSAPVVDALAPHFPRRWQAMAWSDGKVSRNADLLQRVGHYHPIPRGRTAGSFDEDVLLVPSVPFLWKPRPGGPFAPQPPATHPAPQPAPVTPAPRLGAAPWVANWRAVQGDKGGAFLLLQRWANETFPAYCAISPVAPVYGPQTAAFLREFARRLGIPNVDGGNIGPKLSAALVAEGFAQYLDRAGFRG